MNYAQVYQDFIKSRRAREARLSEYETHHVVPRCLGGDDSSDNLIRLSLGDHLFAHKLLARIHGGPLSLAVTFMLNRERYSGRRSRLKYNAFRVEAHKVLSAKALERCGDSTTLENMSLRAKQQWMSGELAEIMKSPAVCEKRVAGIKRNYQDPSFREKMRSALTGRKFSEAGKNNLSAAMGKPEYRAKLSAALRGRRFSEEHKAKLAEAMRQRWKKKRESELTGDVVT